MVHALLLLTVLGAVGRAHTLARQAPEEPRIRLVPQSTQNLIMDIQESADGGRLLTHDRRLTPRLWDARTLSLLLVMRGHTDSVKWLSFTPDGRRIVTLSNAEAIIWDGVRARPERTLSPNAQTFSTAGLSRDSRRLAIGTLEGDVLVYDLEGDGAPLRLRGHGGLIQDVEFSADGTALASASEDQSARVWRLSDPGRSLTLTNIGASARWVDLSRDGRLLAVTTLDNKATVFDCRSGNKLYEKPHFVSGRSVGNVQMGAVFVGQDERLLVATQAGPMQLLDPASGVLRSEMKGHTGGLREIRVTKDRSRVATAGDDQEIMVWNVADGTRFPFTIASGTPTAGEFSNDNNVFWVGYSTGAIRRHDLSTGQHETEALGSVLEVATAYPVADGLGLAMDVPAGLYIHKPGAPNESKFVPDTSYETPVTSPDGTAVLCTSLNDDEYPWRLGSLQSGKVLMRYKNVLGARFSADSGRFVTWHNDSTVNVWHTTTGELEKSWQLAKDKAVQDVAFVPGTKGLLTYSTGDAVVQLWNYETGSPLNTLSFRPASAVNLAASPDGKRVAAYDEKGLRLWSPATGGYLDGAPVVAEGSQGARLEFSPDGRYVAAWDAGRIRVWATDDGVLVADKPLAVDYVRYDLAGVFAASTDRIVSTDGPNVSVVPLGSGRLPTTVQLADRCLKAFFVNKGTRLVTCDFTDGLTIWDVTADQPKKIGNILMIRDYGWLAYDTQGRFDAEEPSSVRGAAFVKEWEGGLEAISMEQLKSVFYEPGLVAKMLGTEKESMRDVPDLESLRLYPRVSVIPHQDDPMKLTVKLAERDEGGIGNVSLMVNGKQLARKRGAGFFEVNLADHAAFLLPETVAKDGNLVSVTASNADGTLTSPPVFLNIGFPAGLKVPEVRLFVLCVGVGDYAGQAADLKAPPGDAAALGEALAHAGSKLLPDRVSLTVLSTTDPGGERPTRANVLKWLDERARDATSSDIVLVFLSGHGTNQIGDQRGYFFLTSEADPGDLRPTAIGTATVSAEDLRQRLERIPASKQVVMLDTCHSGAAAPSLLGSARSVGGDYQRAWESIKDATGTWMLAGSASDQLSYESPNVEHGVLTYALLEALDQVSAAGMRPGSGDEFFLDVERWLRYAAERVEGLKAEVGLGGIQRPEFKRSTTGTSFDLGVATPGDRGRLKLQPPRPIVILGEFEQEKEDPLLFEEHVRQALRESHQVKAWFDVPRHPGVYRLAGEYTLVESNGDVSVKVYVQRLDSDLKRKTLTTFLVSGPKDDLVGLAAKLRQEAERLIVKSESERRSATGSNLSAQPPR